MLLTLIILASLFSLCKVPLLLYFVVLMLVVNLNEEFNNATFNNNDKIIPSLGKCAKECCPNYYSTGLFNDVVIDDKYTTSNLTCRDGVRDAGCVCLNKQENNSWNNYNLLGTDDIHNVLDTKSIDELLKRNIDISKK